jgi:tetratricopeptide (TPR) repeat protein
VRPCARRLPEPEPIACVRQEINGSCEQETVRPRIQNAAAFLLFLGAALVQALARPSLELRKEVDDAFDAAVEDVQRGNLTSARAQLETALRAHPNHPGSHELLGQVLDKLGSHEEALPHLRKAAALSPEQQPFWNNLAVVCLRVSKIEEAETALQRSLSMGSSALPFRLLGIIRFHQYRTREGLSYFEKSLAISPDDVRSWYYVASAHDLLGETDAALHEYQEALKRFPTDFHNRLGFAKMLQKMGMYREAIDALYVARNLEPGNAEVHELLSRAYLKTGDVQSALKSARQATSLSPNNAGFHYQLGTALARAGQGAEASAEFGVFRRLNVQENKSRKVPWALDDNSELSFDKR